MAPARDAGDVTSRMSGRHPPEEEEDVTMDDYAIAAVILAIVLICVIIALVIYSCCQRRSVTQNSWCSMLCSSQCPCPCNRRRREDLTMGYFPANITVNSAAVEQGVPDIFLRADSSQGGGDGRISLEPYSLDNSSSPKVLDSPTTVETSGTWSEYLRRVTLVRRSNAAGVGGTAAPGDRPHVPNVSSERGPPQGASHHDKDLRGITSPVAVDLLVDDDSRAQNGPRGGQDDVMIGAAHQRP